MTPYVLRARRIAPDRFRVTLTVGGRRRQGTYGPPPPGCPLPHAWAADQHGRRFGLATDSSPLWGATRGPALAFQAWGP